MPPISTTAIGTRSSTSIRTVSGHWRVTSASRTSRQRLDPRLDRGEVDAGPAARPSRSPAAARTSSARQLLGAGDLDLLRPPAPEEKKTSQSPPTTSATRRSAARTYFQASQRRAHWRRANARRLRWTDAGGAGTLAACG